MAVAQSDNPERILIYRLGSLGDTIVALPCFHLLARLYPKAERRVLTNLPVASRAAPLEAVLDGSGLIHGTIEYTLEERRARPLVSLWKTIRSWKPDLLVYLAEPRGQSAVRRDLAFFRLCRIPKIVGAPKTPELAEHLSFPERDMWEPEAERLGRCLAPLGDAAISDPANWDLRLTTREKATAKQILAEFGAHSRFIVLSIGTKFQVNDWEDQNWRAVLKNISRGSKELGLVLMGADEERSRSDGLAQSWSGPVLNLCSRTTPRESAAVLEKAALYLGHDSGPMHLADAVGTQCIVVFSARNRPGIWFPYRQGNVIFYERTSCFNCGLSVCSDYDKKCIRAVLPEQVADAALAALAAK